jgi:hypothetical protein
MNMAPQNLTLVHYTAFVRVWSRSSTTASGRQTGKSNVDAFEFILPSTTCYVMFLQLIYTIKPAHDYEIQAKYWSLENEPFHCHEQDQLQSNENTATCRGCEYLTGFGLDDWIYCTYTLNS